MPVNESEEFCAMFTSKLNGMQLLYGAEMDGIESDQLVDLTTCNLERVNFVELKVHRRASNGRQQQNFYRYKVRNWWCQCFLVGVSKVIMGERDDDGIVDELHTLDINEIAKGGKVRNVRRAILQIKYYIDYCFISNSGDPPFVCSSVMIFWIWFGVQWER